MQRKLNPSTQHPFRQRFFTHFVFILHQTLKLVYIYQQTENHQTSGTLTKTALLESLKSGQVSPAIATLVSSLLTSVQQQQQQQQIRVK